MAKSTNKAPKNSPITTPVVWISGWTDVVPVLGRVEKGVTLYWKLPVGALGVVVKVDGVLWGRYTTPTRKLNIAYPNLARTTAGNPVKVELRFLNKRKYTTVYILDKPDNINLILADVIIARNIGGNAGTLCPTANYSSLVTASYTGGSFYEIQYGDKDASGKFKALRIKITPSGGPEVICVVNPGTTPSDINTRAVDRLIVEEACISDLKEDFTDQNTGSPNNQRFGQNTSAAQNINIKTFRNYEADKMAIRIECPQSYTIEAKLLT